MQYKLWHVLVAFIVGMAVVAGIFLVPASFSQGLIFSSSRVKPVLSFGNKLYVKRCALIEAFITDAGLLGTVNIPSNQQTFKDVPPSDSCWIYAETAVAYSILDSYRETLSKNDFVTRAEAIKSLDLTYDISLLRNNDPYIATPHFKDVPKTAWYYIYIESANAAGVNLCQSEPSCNNGSFNPSGYATTVWVEGLTSTTKSFRK